MKKKIRGKYGLKQLCFASWGENFKYLLFQNVKRKKKTQTKSKPNPKTFSESLLSLHREMLCTCHLLFLNTTALIFCSEFLYIACTHDIQLAMILPKGLNYMSVLLPFSAAVVRRSTLINTAILKTEVQA